MKSIRLFILMLFISLKSFAQVDSCTKMIDLVNFVRTNPKAVKSYIENFASRDFVYGKTEQGRIAVKEALNFLDTVKPVDSLKYSEEIFMAIGDHTGIDTVTGVVKHDCKTLLRISKYNKSFHVAGENYMLITKTSRIGSNAFIRQYSMIDVLLSFIIDINMKDKGHRKNIFDPDYKFIAVRIINVKGQLYLFQEFAGY